MVTKHSIKRARQRLGCNKKGAERIVALALERGQDYNSFSDRERKYLEERSKYATNTFCVYYNGAIYVFSDSGFCITVLNSPKWFGKTKYYYKNERIRDPRRVYSYNLMEEELVWE